MADINKIVVSTRIKNDASTVINGGSRFTNVNPDRKPITFLDSSGIQGQIKRREYIEFTVVAPTTDIIVGQSEIFIVPTNLTNFYIKTIKTFVTTGSGDLDSIIEITKYRNGSLSSSLIISHNMNSSTDQSITSLSSFDGNAFLLANDLIVVVVTEQNSAIAPKGFKVIIEVEK